MASRNQELDKKVSPVSKYLSWKNLQTVKVVDGEEYKKITGGEFQYYDKTLFNDKTQKDGLNVSVTAPFEFAVIYPDAFSYKGNDKANENKYIWTKELSPFSKGMVELKSKDGAYFEFSMEDYNNKEAKYAKREAIKQRIKGICKDINYTQSVYIAVKLDGKWELQNLQLQKAPLTGGNGKKRGDEIPPEDQYDGWFGFNKLNKDTMFSHTVVVNGIKPKKNGDISFMIPVYEVGSKISREDSLILGKLCTQVEEFLKYQGNAQVKTEEPVTTEASTDEDYMS